MKGFTVGTIAELIIAIIVMVVVLPILFRAAGNVWDQLAESFGIVKYSPIERALICYYYLCTEGCSGPKFNDFCSSDKIGRENYEGVCSFPASLGVDGEQCYKAYWQFPMRVKLDSESELSMDRLKKKVEKKFVVIEDSNTKVDKSFLTQADFAYFPDGQYMTDKDYWNYEQLVPLAKIENAVKFGKVKPDSSAYDIAGVIQGDGSIKIPFGHFATYYTFHNGGSYEINVNNGRIIRMSIEDEKTADLKDYNYLMNISAFPLTKYPSGFYIEFWNDPKSPNTIKKDCANQECSAEVTFNTKKGKIIVNVKKVEPVGCDIYTGLYCSDFNIKLNITYTKT
jgi:hypothetical protein